jgi:hypothetical protein
VGSNPTLSATIFDANLRFSARGAICGDVCQRAPHLDELDDRTCRLERKKSGIIETTAEKASAANDRM